MLVFIDESGCPGFKSGKGSTSYFVIAMVIFDSNLEAQLVNSSIADLKTILGLKTEFKFSKTKIAHKDLFFEAVKSGKFKVRALVVDKEHIYSNHLRTDKDSFYSFFIKNLLKYDADLLLGANIKLDGNGDKHFRNKLSAYLRKELNPGKIAKFSFVDSRKNNLIQLADMVAGAIARSYKDHRSESRRWLDMLRRNGQVDNIWNFR